MLEVRAEDYSPYIAVLYHERSNDYYYYSVPNFHMLYLFLSILNKK